MNLHKVKDWIIEKLTSNDVKINHLTDKIMVASILLKKRNYTFYELEIEGERDKYEINDLLGFIYSNKVIKSKYAMDSVLPFPVIDYDAKSSSFVTLHFGKKHLDFPIKSLTDKFSFISDNYRLDSFKYSGEKERKYTVSHNPEYKGKISKNEILKDLINLNEKLESSTSFFYEYTKLIENENVTQEITDKFVKEYKMHKEMLSLLLISMPHNNQDLMLKSMLNENIAFSKISIINTLEKITSAILLISKNEVLLDAVSNMKEDLLNNAPNCKFLNSYFFKEKLSMNLENKNNLAKRLKI